MEAEFTSTEPEITIDLEKISQDSISQDSISQDPISQDPISQDPISQDPISQDSISQDSISQDPISQDPISQDSISQDSISQDTISFTSEGSAQASQEVIEIRDYLKAFSDKYLVEETTEETTDFIKEIYNVQLTQGAVLSDISSHVLISGKDQQTIGLLNIASSFVLIGIAVMFIFLGRLR